MITVIGILVGAIIVALIWMCVYFNQEIHDVMAEMRARDGGYYHTPCKKEYHYSEFIANEERDSWMRRYHWLKERYEKLLERNAELEQELTKNWAEDDLPEDDDELDD